MKAAIFCHKLSLFGEDIRVSAAAAADRSAVTRHPLATAARARVGTRTLILPLLGVLAYRLLPLPVPVRAQAVLSPPSPAILPPFPLAPALPDISLDPPCPAPPSLSLPPLSDLNYIALWVGSLEERKSERDGTTEVGSIVVCGGGGRGSPLSRRGGEEGSSSSTGRLEARIGGPDCAQHLHERRGRTKKCRLSG